jgi:hypothetical protein
MQTLTNNIGKLLKKYEVDVTEESVVLAFEDGTVSVELDEEETKTIKLDVSFVDRVITVEGSLEDLLEEDDE